MTEVPQTHREFEDTFRELMDSLMCEPKAHLPPVDRYWLDQSCRYMQHSKRRGGEINACIPRSPDPLKVLDVGTTHFTLLIKALYPHYEVATLDLSTQMEARCSEAGVEFETCDLDEVHVPFEDSRFDVIVFCEVLEHIFARPSEILNEIRRVLGPQGRLILSVPNIAALYQRVRLLFGKSPLDAADLQMGKGRLGGHGHLHEYTMKEITSLLESAGFAIRKKKYVCADTGDEGGMLRLARRAYDAAVLFVPPFRSTILVECCRKPEESPDDIRAGG
jgi:SAM-dependent methyltransferase